MFKHWHSRITQPWLYGLSCAITLALPAAGHAAVREVDVREQARVAMERFQREQPQATVQVNPATGLVRSLANLCDPRSLACGGVEGATAFLAEHRAMLLGDRAVEELQLSAVHQLPTSSHVCYQQCYRGLPIWGAQLAVHLNAQGQVRMVQGGIRPLIQIETTPVLTAAEAIRAAQGTLGGAELRREPTVALGVLPLADGPRLAYRIEIATHEPADWRIDVDARSGALLKKLNRLMHVDGEGIVVDESPLTTPELVSRPFRHLSGEGILKGDFADVYSFDRYERLSVPTPVPVRIAHRKRLSQAADHRFTAPPTDVRFDEQMLYYHVNRVHDYFSRTFGFTDRDHSLKVYAHELEIDEKTHRVVPYDNAHYSHFEDALHFGDGIGSDNGGVNPTSRDADVIYHEYTHGVIARIIPHLAAKEDDFGAALNEAYADYFACTITDDPHEAEYTVGDPDGMRNLENRHRYPEDVNHPDIGAPESHYTGMIWGGACWDLRQKLGAAVADQVIFHSIYYLPNDGSATFQMAAQGVLEADKEKYGGAHQEAIRQVISQRGILH